MLWPDSFTITPISLLPVPKPCAMPASSCCGGAMSLLPTSWTIVTDRSVSLNGLNWMSSEPTLRHFVDQTFERLVVESIQSVHWGIYFTTLNYAQRQEFHFHSEHGRDASVDHCDVHDPVPSGSPSLGRHTRLTKKPHVTCFTGHQSAGGAVTTPSNTLCPRNLV